MLKPLKVTTLRLFYSVKLRGHNFLPGTFFKNEYLLYGCGLKHQIFFKRSEFFFNVKNQREFT